MNIEILERPANTIAKLTMDQGDEMTAEGGSMVAMAQDMVMETTTHKRGKGGIMKGLKRMLAGENLFLNHYKSYKDGSPLYLAPNLSGDIIHKKLGAECPTLIVQGSSFLAHGPDIDMDMSWQGAKNLFSREGLFWLKFTGTGDLLLNAFGAIYPVEVTGEHIVDTGHIVAFEDTLDFNLSKVGKSWIGSFAGGEGLVCRFKGTGTVWCQSHNANSFGWSIGPKLRAV
jgi:uncharacterized protein (TIGR00266 family)